MSKWLDLVKSVSKVNPGKPLNVILPIASAKWKKMKGTSNTKKMNYKSAGRRRKSSRRKRSSSKR